MKKFLSLSIIAFLLVSTISCSKQSDSSPFDNLFNQWNLVKIVYTDVATKEETTQTFIQGSYLRFNTNGLCNSLVDGIANTTTWHFIGDNDGIFIESSSGFASNDSGYTMKTLTAQSLVLYSKEIIDGNNQTIYLQK